MTICSNLIHTLFSLTIDFFDDHIEDEIDLEKFIYVGSKIGFKKSQIYFHLRNLPIADYNTKSENLVNWRIEIAEKLQIL